MSALGTERTESLAEKVKVCNTCGDAGFDDCLAFCNHCNEGAEHVYCMVRVFDTVPQDWICEGCKVKQRENSRKRRLVSDGLRPSHAQKKQVQSNSSSTKGIKLLHSSLNKKGSSENGTEQFVTLQAVKAPSNGPACQVLSMGGATMEKISLAERDQTRFPSTVTQKLSNNISNEINSVCIVASDVNKPSHSVMPARNLSAKESSFSERDKAVSISRCYNDIEEITQKDWPSVLPEIFTETISTSTVSNSEPASVVAQIVKDPSCLTEHQESVFVQDASAIAIDMKTSGERIGSEEQELNNTVVTSLAEGKQLSVEAEHCNVNKTMAFSLSSLAKPVATEKEEMEVISGSGKLLKAEHHNVKKTKALSLSSLAKPAASDKESTEGSSQTGKPVPIDRTASTHTISTVERNTINADSEAPIHTDILIRKPIFNAQSSTINSTLMKSESMKVASSYTKNKVVPLCTTAPICEAFLVERKNVNGNEDVQNHMNISIEKPISNAQDAIINSTSLKSEPMKGTPCSETGNVVSACGTSPILATPLSERIEEDPIISSDLSFAKPHVIFNSKSTKTESDVLVKRSRLHARKVAIRDFPIISKKIRILGEGEKIPNLTSKGKLLIKSVAPSGVEELLDPLIQGGNVLVKEDTATAQEMNGCSKNKEHQESGGFLVKRTTTGQEIDSSCNKAKEEEIAANVSLELPSLFDVVEKAQPQNVKHKAGTPGSQSCLINGPAECPSLFSEEEKTQPQNVQLKGGMAGSPSCLMIGSAESPSEEEKTEPQNVKQKGGAAGSSSSLIKKSGLGKVGLGSTKAPSHSVPVIERNGESLVVSPSTSKGPSSEVVPTQENSMSVASGAGMYKISGLHAKRVAKRDFPPLKAQIGKAGEIVGPSCKPKVASPSEDKKQVTGNKSDTDTEEFIGRDVPSIAQEVLPKNKSDTDTEEFIGRDVPSIAQEVPSIAQEVLPKKLKNASSSISMRNCIGVMMPLQDEKSLPCLSLPVEGLSSKQPVSFGVDIKAASIFQSKESAIFPSSSLHTRPKDKECHGNAKQECDAKGLVSCVRRELPTDGVSSTIRDEVASVIKIVPTNSEPASKRKTTKKNLSSLPCKEGSSRKGVATSKSTKGPPCLPGEMEGVTDEDTSKVQLDKKEVFGRGPPSRSDGLCVLLNNSTEGDRVDVTGGRHILRQKGEALNAVAISSCQVKSSGNVSLPEGIVIRNASNAPPAKVTFTGKRASSAEVDYDFADRDFSDKVEFSPGRHTSRSQCAFNRSTCVMDDCEQLSFFEPRRRGSPRRNKGAVRSSMSSIRERHGNATYTERESEDNGFHARCEVADCEPSDHRMGLRKSTLIRPRHHTLADRGGEKQDHYSRGSRHEAHESSSYKGVHRCHRCEAIGHSAECCKADGQKEWRTPFFSDFDDGVLDLGHAKRECKGFQASDGRKRWRYDPEREERFMNSRSLVDSDAVDCVQPFKRPPKAPEHTRYDEECRYKSHLREEASFEREASRLETSHFLNGMQSESKPFPHSKPSEYTRVHKRQIVRVQTEDCCKVDTHCENGKAFPVQGNASSCLAGPAGLPRSGYVNRLLSNQVPSTSQDQVWKDRISETHVPSQMHGSSVRNFSQKRRAAPDLQVMWTGCFYVSSKKGWETCYQGLQARPSNLAHSKVFEALLALPVKLKMEEKKRGVESNSWPRSFQESPPTSHSIGIYFFPTDMESYGRWYKPLVNRLAARDFALQVKLDFAQLLIFPSQILPEAEQFWEDRFFLWGIFRRNVEDSNRLLRQPSCRDPGSDLGSPTGNGEVIDMDVGMVGGEDSVSQHFNPPLPPGFPPAPPYHP